MGNTWIKTLKQLRVDISQDMQAGSLPVARVDNLLQSAKAFESLRDIQKYFLNGVGKIELFENASGYDVVIALMWDGTDVNPSHPKPNSNSTRYIFVGVHDRRLWVNGKPVNGSTADDLQSSLLEACKSPGTRAELKNR